MPSTLTESCRKFTVSRGVVSAECKKADGKTYHASSIALDPYLGNIDGKFVWGGKDFSHSAESVIILDCHLIGKLKNASGKYVEAKFDLGHYVHNNNGILECKTPGPIKLPETLKPAPPLERTTSTGSNVSTAASTAYSSFSAISAATSATSVSSESYAKSAFSSSSFRSQSKQLLIEDTCSKLELRGNHLHVECVRLDGCVVETSIDLDTCIGNNDGRLEWGRGGFSKTCESFSLDGFFLVANCRHHGDKNRYSLCRLDLRQRLRNCDGVLIIIELDQKLSVVLSEVPWMKFKVIAEPDLSVFACHPVIQETLIKISESTVEHVTLEMHRRLTIAMAEAITVVTASAMSHIAVMMKTIVSDVAGCATARPSYTEAEYLHVGHGHGHGHGHKHVHGNDCGCGEVYNGGGGYSNGGTGYGGGIAVGGGGGYSSDNGHSHNGYETPDALGGAEYGVKNGYTAQV